MEYRTIQQEDNQLNEVDKNYSDMKKNVEGIHHLFLDFKQVNNKYVLKIEMKDLTDHEPVIKTYYPDSLNFEPEDFDENCSHFNLYVEELPEMHFYAGNNIVTIYHLILNKINDDVFQLSLNMSQDFFDPLLICEFGHIDQNTYIDISPHSAFDFIDYDYKTEWEIMKNSILFASADIIKCSMPRWFFLTCFCSNTIQITSILKTNLYQFSYRRKIISGIFIAGKDLCKFHLKSIDFLLNLYNSYNLGERALDFQQDIQSNNLDGYHNENQNMITGISCSDNCFYSGEFLHNINSGAFFCSCVKYNTNSKSSITCSSGTQLVVNMHGTQNVDLLTLGQQGKLFIWNCYLKINDFSCFPSSILYIAKYRNGDVSEQEEFFNIKHNKNYKSEFSISFNCNDVNAICAFSPFLNDNETMKKFPKKKK